MVMKMRVVELVDRVDSELSDTKTEKGQTLLALLVE